MSCRGRFAPSPTGVLHFGSLLAALASFAHARSQGGEWLVRIEDLDRSREVSGAARRILEGLGALGFDWDGPVVYQSHRAEAYAAALRQLERQGLAYPCGCSRSEVAALGRPGPEGMVYPGTCRSGLPPGRARRALRLRTPPGRVRFRDSIQGEQIQDVLHETGDCVLLRADGIPAYQLAVVVDDAWQGVDQVVRGADLLVSTPRQILLQRALGLPTPTYAHIPVALDDSGRKLSKSLAAAPVDPGDPLPPLRLAWDWLGQAPAPRPCTLRGFWSHAIARWQIDRVPRVKSALVPDQRKIGPGTREDVRPLPSSHPSP